MYNRTDDVFSLLWAKRIKAIRMLGGKCVNCGNNSIYTMEFHHIDKNKDFTLGNNISKQKMWEFIEREINKCKLLCSNCHSEEHYRGGRVSDYKIEILKDLGIEKCSFCGYRGKNFNSLCFHHVDSSSKDFDISNFLARKEGVSVERLFDEIKKCKVICRNCHKLEHIDVNRVEGLLSLIEYKINNHKSRKRLDKEIIRKMKNEGMGVCAIAKTLGYGKSTIHYIYHRV